MPRSAQPRYPARRQAPDYPTKPVELVVPFPAGGATDVIARLVAEAREQGMGAPDRHPEQGRGDRRDRLRIRGARKAGRIHAADRDRLDPRGAAGLSPDLPYDTVTSFAPATLLAVFPNMLVVNPKKRAGEEGRGVHRAR